MECKSFYATLSAIKLLELIDTLWNVNTSQVYFLSDYDVELIDTLWNVNVLAVLG